MTLTVNRKGVNRLLYAAVCFMYIMGFLVQDLGLPMGIMAVLDAVVFLSLLFSLCYFGRFIHNTEAGYTILLSAVLLMVAVANGLKENVNLILIVDGIRNNYRGMLTFCVVVCLLRKGTADRIVHLTEKIFNINVVVCTIQSFLLGVSHDNCNGLFGVGKMNSWTNILLCVMSVYYISRYMNRLIPLRKVGIKILLCMYIAILAELKVYFFELVFILMALVVLEKPSLRTFIICFVGGLVLFAMIGVFIAFWEDNSVFTIEGLKYYLDPDRSYGYSAQGDWGRIGGVAKAAKKFFLNDLNLFGMGLGYCGFDTPFYFRYEWLHYNWFSYISIFLEQGWVGLVGYVVFFVLNIITLRKKKKKAKSVDAKVVYDISLIMSLLGIVLLIYNSTITGYSAFYLYLLIGIAYRYELNDGVNPMAKHSLRYSKVVHVNTDMQ